MKIYTLLISVSALIISCSQNKSDQIEKITDTAVVESSPVMTFICEGESLDVKRFDSIHLWTDQEDKPVSISLLFAKEDHQKIARFTESNVGNKIITKIGEEELSTATIMSKMSSSMTLGITEGLSDELYKAMDSMLIEGTTTRGIHSSYDSPTKGVVEEMESMFTK